MLGKDGVHPESVDQIAFFVLAPKTQIQSGIFGDLVTKESIEKKVRARVVNFQGFHDTWFEEFFLPTLAHMEVGTLAWEDALSSLPSTPEVEAMLQFYAQCLRFNPGRVY